MFGILRRPDARFAKDVRPCPCINVHEQMLSKSTILSIDMASRSLGAARFIELSRWSGRYGNAGAALNFSVLSKRR
ncbi:hypothetical protein [Noviherbaspirillum malthae]|uniref:hypothetical protein n=1 Tax=Noviherbaspirillum malthae TaxID=1260987 RepID=UPI00188E1585|nr:hypothetical protein [Noviherbaspirillum malthae]